MIRYLDISEREAWSIIQEQIHDDETARRIREHVSATERFIGVYYNDEALGVFGGARATLLSQEGYIWFTHAPALNQHPIAFGRKSLEILDDLFRTFPVLYGVSFSKKSQRWLSWGGAKFTGDTFVFRRPH